MARRWTPQRFVVMRRIRILVCVLALIISSTGIFTLSARKSVALIVNGKTRIVTTYASTAQRLLQEQKIPVKTHDQVISTSGEILADHTTVTVRSAYQTSVTVDGITIPFWTVATSVDQLIGFFQANADHAAKITVNLQNIYDKLTGGLSINKKGPVEVICDGKSRIAPDGTLPASSILDSLGIVLGKEDRVTVSENGSQTVLRILRVTHGKESRNVIVPFNTRTINDPNLPSGVRVVRQSGINGERTDLYNVTYVDGKAESSVLIKQNVITPTTDQIVAVGSKPNYQAPKQNKQSSNNTNGKTSQKPSSNTNLNKTNTKQEIKPQESKNLLKIVNPNKVCKILKTITIVIHKISINLMRIISKILLPLLKHKHLQHHSQHHKRQLPLLQPHQHLLHQPTIPMAWFTPLLSKQSYMLKLHVLKLVGLVQCGKILLNCGQENLTGVGTQKMKALAHTEYHNLFQQTKWRAQEQIGTKMHQYK